MSYKSKVNIFILKATFNLRRRDILMVKNKEVELCELRYTIYILIICYNMSEFIFMVRIIDLSNLTSTTI